MHLEGEILKKQKKGGQLKKYWFVLLGLELYCYKNKGDLKHKEMKSLSGIYIKDEEDCTDESGVKMYPFMLIFPNKRRIYYFLSREDKLKWFEAIKERIGYTNMNDFYNVGDVLGKGKYGVVRQGIHKRTKQVVAIKVVKKKDLSLKDHELLRREIEVLKVCQHPYIMRFFDVFEN